MPGETTISHSSGCMFCHAPVSDQARIWARLFADGAWCCGTPRYGPLDAESEGPRDSPAIEEPDFDAGRLVRRTVPNLPKFRRSPTVDTPSSFSSLESESDVTESISSTSERSLPDDDSVAVEGSYSCLSGDEDLLPFLMKAGVNDGTFTDFKPKELDFRFSDVSSLFGVFCRFCSFDGAETGSSDGLRCELGVSGGVDRLCLGIVGSSKDGTDEVLLRIPGRSGRGGLSSPRSDSSDRSP